MPEGDSVAKDAERLRPKLVGRSIQGVDGTAPSVRVNSQRILGSTVERIETVGKHLFVHFDSGWSAHVHLGMTGSWRVQALPARDPGEARLVLVTEFAQVACYGAPVVEVERSGRIVESVRHLGPDLLGDFDPDEFIRRARSKTGPVARVLLDQTVLAGLGNVYKSELLFLERIHPETSVGDISDAALKSIADRGRRLLRANVAPGRRSTAGPGQMWVYGRSGKSCRRCGVAVASKMLFDRPTFWCPGCQIVGNQPTMVPP